MNILNMKVNIERIDGIKIVKEKYIDLFDQIEEEVVNYEERIEVYEKHMNKEWDMKYMDRAEKK